LTATYTDWLINKNSSNIIAYATCQIRLETVLEELTAK